MREKIGFYIPPLKGMNSYFEVVDLAVAAFALILIALSHRKKA